MEFKDYYRIMGVERDATQDEIKRAYRQRARKYHPDVSKEADAEARFKEVGEAYEVLKDPEKRAAYDQLGANWKAGQEFRPPPDWKEGFEFSGGGFTGGDTADYSDFFESLYGRGSRPGQGSRASFHAQGEDRHAFFLEDIKTFVHYAAGKEIRAADSRFKDPDKPYIFTSIVNAQRDARAAGSTIEPIDPKDIIRILLFQALVGNYDWELRISPGDIPDSQGLWNIKVVEAGGNWIVFPYDYDLAGWVKSQDFALLDEVDVKSFKPTDISLVVAEFKEKRPAIEALVDDLAKEDKSGARSIKEQISSFYNALDRRFR